MLYSPGVGQEFCLTLAGMTQAHTCSQLRKVTPPLPTPWILSLPLHTSSTQPGKPKKLSSRALEGGVLSEAGNTRFGWGSLSCPLFWATASGALWRRRELTPQLQWLVAITLLVRSKYLLLYVILYSKFYILFLKEKPKGRMCGAPRNPNLSLPPRSLHAFRTLCLAVARTHVGGGARRGFTKSLWVCNTYV